MKKRRHPSLRMLPCIFLLFAAVHLNARTPLQSKIHSIIQGKNASVGVAVLYNGKELTTVNDSIRYPMMSTFKFPLALAVLDYLDKNKLSLDTEIFIPAYDLHPDTYSPLRERRPEGNYHLSIRELLKYTVSLSDNNTCDILIKYLGGVGKIQDYLTTLGIRGMVITATEDDMHKKENPYLNHTTPSAAVRLLEKFLKKDLFAPEYREFLEQTMLETTTGPDKLKGLLPADLLVGHKTGSSDRNAQGMKFGDNDLGFVLLPHHKHYAIAVFVMDSMENDAENAAIIARISKAVYDCYKE